MDAHSLLFFLLRQALCPDTPEPLPRELLTRQLLADTLALAQKQDLAHMAGYALKKLGITEHDDIARAFDRQHMQALYRYMQLNHEYEQICRTLEAQGIPYIPLKGSVIRGLYPQPWMRTSCDIDILVQKETLRAAIAALTQTLGYTEGKKEAHDVSLHSAGGVHLELHFDTIHEDITTEACRSVLGRVWEDARPLQPGSCHYSMSDELFYFYHIAHMAKHVKAGGCGIRPFMDLWLLDRSADHHRQRRDALLQAGGMLKFAESARAVAEVWFSQAQADPLSTQLSAYVLGAGIYGSFENLAAVGQAKAGSRGKYFFQRIFMPLADLKYFYPVLKKHVWLAPFCQLHRWGRILFRGRMNRAVRELQASGGDFRATAQLLDRLEIS